MHTIPGDLKATSEKVQPKLKDLYAKKIELEKQLAEVNSAISEKETVLSPIPANISEKNKEMAALISEGIQISNELKLVSDSSKNDEQLMAYVESVRINAQKAINSLFNL